MRLHCDVALLKENVNRSNASLARCHRHIRPSKGFVTLSRSTAKGDKRYVLHVSTRSAIKGQPIEVTPKNVREIHQSHVAAGRLTLVFVQPRISVIIMKCNPSHLQRFLDNLLAALRGDEISISTLAKVRRSDFKAASTVLQVTQGDLKVVPSRLSELEVIELVGCELRSVESRWFALPMLLCLELADNCLGKATDFVKFKLLSRLKNLQYLSLMNNEIETIPPYFFESLPPSLITLNLSHNRIVSLPKSLVNVRNLRTLYLGHNLLSHLPRDMSDMDLRCLCVDHNRLPWLPHDLRSRRFEKLYFSNNPMVAPSPYIIGPVVPSLTSVAFASLRSHSLQEDILPWDLKMIGDNLCMKCSCCRLWTATSLLSMCLVGERVSEFADETDTMQPVTMRSFSCQKCVGRVTVSLPSPFRP